MTLDTTSEHVRLHIPSRITTVVYSTFEPDARHYGLLAVPPEDNQPIDYTIVPLTFLQVYRTTGTVLDALLERDTTLQQWLGRSPMLRTVAVATAIPLYYHWATSGYGVLDGAGLVGWLYMRGWKQVLYIETLAVIPEWRGRGVGTALIRFAEAQARELNREWLGLTVSVGNEDAVHRYESQGFRRGHWRMLCTEGSSWGSQQPSCAVSLRPLLGSAIKRAYHHFATLDLVAGDQAIGELQSRFLCYEAYRTPMGKHWTVAVQDREVAYLHRHGSVTHPVLYLAAEPSWWGSPELQQALRLALSDIGPRPLHADIRLASSGHHDVAHAALSPLGFVERPAATMKMFKHVVRN